MNLPSFSNPQLRPAADPPPAPFDFKSTKKEVEPSNFGPTLNAINVKPKTKLDYVTSAQGRIFIGGILVDECYDLQYTYQESKEPIYGYNSKNFDAMLPGQVIIYGNFTINYKHDSYLWSILSKVKEGESISQSKKRLSDNTALDNSYAGLIKQYRVLQNQLNEAKKTLKVSKAYSEIAKAELMDAQEKHRLDNQDLDARYAQAQSKEEEFYSSLGEMDAAALQHKRAQVDSMITNPTWSLQQLEADMLKDLDEYNVKIDRERTIISELEDQRLVIITEFEEDPSNHAIYNEQLQSIDEMIEASNKKISDLEQYRDEWMQGYQEAIQEKREEVDNYINSDETLKESMSLELSTKRAQADKYEFENSAPSYLYKEEGNKEAESTYQKDKDEVSRLSNQLEDIKKKLRETKEKQKKNGADLTSFLQEKESDLIEEKRPEDFKGFNIFIEYNGAIHKVLEGCHLTGHSHVITQSGQPVREYYNFVARKIA